MDIPRYCLCLPSTTVCPQLTFYDEWTFQGLVDIYVDVKARTHRVLVNSVDLDIGTVKAFSLD